MIQEKLYLSLARKYRPKNFSELCGQDSIARVISHAIISERLVQGYLFTGTRGTGKTSFARIIAKTVNCKNSVIKEDEIKPCEICMSCKAYLENRHPDILEIDAASKTSVDDVRQIIESSEYKPIMGLYKIFIIDEIHMLSKGAFNALLKVLEEPPSHVIFIFATTEIYKIPLTVISRCQRFDLRRLSLDHILKLLELIINKEQINFTTEALKLIALKSDGSARDALMLVEQARSIIRNNHEVISAKLVYEMLGLIEVDIIIKLILYVVNQDAYNAIDLINKTFLSLSNFEPFIEQVLDLLAYLNKAKILADYYHIIFNDFKDEISEILNKTSLARLSILWQIYIKGIEEVKASSNQALVLEMLVIKSMYSQALPSLENLNIVNTSDRIKVDSNSIVTIKEDNTLGRELKKKLI